MKICKHCFKEKDLSEFIPSKLTLDGTISTCKECSRKRRNSKPKKEVTLIEKECFCCKQIKLAKDFPRNTALNGGLHTWCKKCVHNKLNESGYYALMLERKSARLKTDSVYREKVNTEKRKNRIKNINTSLLANCRIRANLSNLEFNLDISDIIIPEICPILKTLIICGDKSDYNNSPSVDRIDNTKGYTKDNIQIISTRANRIKNSATISELLLFAEWINKRFNN